MDENDRDHWDEQRRFQQTLDELVLHHGFLPVVDMLARCCRTMADEADRERGCNTSASEWAQAAQELDTFAADWRR